MNFIKITIDNGKTYINPLFISEIHPATGPSGKTSIQMSSGQYAWCKESAEEILALIQEAQNPKEESTS